MLEHDPNGYSWEIFPGLTYSDFLDNLAAPCDWPMPDTAPTTPPDDEELTEPND